VAILAALDAFYLERRRTSIDSNDIRSTAESLIGLIQFVAR